MTDRIRLHISPLNPELLRLALGSVLLSSASDISYHILQTFPERSYGYVELPDMEGKKLKKKLNGSILKGSKIRVEEARPSRKRKAAGDEDGGEEAEEGEKKKKDKPKKKQKLEDGVIPGHELPEGRKVKRGWTDPVKPSKEKRSKEKPTIESRKVKTEASSYTDKPECLFKTKLPQNSEIALDEQQDKPPNPAKKRKAKAVKKEVVVHEFENTTKHASFLRTNQTAKDAKSAHEFVEGRGWIDEDGNVVEKAAATKKGEARSKPTKILSPARTRSKIEVQSRDVSEDKPNGGPHLPKTRKNAAKSPPSEEDDETSSSGTSSSSSDSESDEEKETALVPLSGSDIPALTITPEPADNVIQPEQLAEAPSTSVHPLEQLYKRSSPAGSPKSSLKPTTTPRSTPRNPNLKVQTSFSFFDEDKDDMEDIPKTSKEVGDANDDSFTTNGSRKRPPRVHKQITIPQTPFTQLDFHERGIRSAAPTPDTAAPNKVYFEGLWKRGSADNESSDEDIVKGAQEESSGLGVDLEAVQEEAEEDDEEPLGADAQGLTNGKAKSTEGEEKPESEFSKWFWEHRGEVNRAWKQRRREAKKEKRRADKKKAGGRVR